MRDENSHWRGAWKRPTWIAIILAASVAFTFVFACAMPFAAVATIAVLTMSRREALSVAVGAWLASQAVGFAVLHYPWTWECLTWGVVLGMSALLSTMAAEAALARAARMGALASAASAFLGAFAAYEAALIAASLILGGTETYTLAIQGKIFAMNALALAGLLALSRAGVSLGIVPPVVTAPAPFALEPNRSQACDPS